MPTTILNASGVVFGDGTTQTTKTPTNISEFTNDSGYVTTADVSATYNLRSRTIGSIGFDSGYAVYLVGQDVDGNIIFGGSYNCNCNC